MLPDLIFFRVTVNFLFLQVSVKGMSLKVPEVRWAALWVGNRTDELIAQHPRNHLVS